MSEPDEARAAPRRLMRFRKAQLPLLPPDSAKRQGDITRLAFQALGREKAIAFLNSDHLQLGARPLDLATASADGCVKVERELERLAARQSVEN